MASSPNPYATPETQVLSSPDGLKDVVVTQLSQNAMCMLGAVIGATAAFVGVTCLGALYIAQLGYVLLHGNLNSIAWGETLTFMLLMMLIASLASTAVFAGIGLIAYYPHRMVLCWTGGLNAKARC